MANSDFSECEPRDGGSVAAELKYSMSLERAGSGTRRQQAEDRGRRQEFAMLMHLILWGMLFGVAFHMPSPTFANDLPKATLNRVTRIVGAFESGNSVSVISDGAKLLQQLDERELVEVNQFLTLKKKPTLQQMLVESRIDLDRPGVTAKISAPTNKEVIYLAIEIKKRVDEIEEQFLLHPVGKGEVSSPEKYTDYEKHFWDLHVFRNRLSNAIQWLRQTQALLDARGRRLSSVKLSADKLAIAQYDFQKRSDEIEKLLNDLEEREAFLRIFRIHDTIGNDIPAAPEKDRFTFAYYIETDTKYLESFFKRFDGQKFKREDLNDRSILEEVSSEALAIRKKYADRIRKGELLFLGMHWWFRGRYGSGPIAKGLLKAPGAHLDEKRLFPLAMPMVPPKPLDPYESNYRIPHYERRHHYTWQVQQEQVYKYQQPPLTRSRTNQTAVPEGNQYRKFY